VGEDCKIVAIFSSRSPLVGEGGFERSEKPGEGKICPLTRLDLTPLDLATLSHERRG
jgi:hypothetical protein